MVCEIIKYSTPLSVEYATDIRVFDDELFAFSVIFIQKMSKEDRKYFEKGVDTLNKSNISQTQADYCPRTFTRDKILLLANIFTLLLFILFIILFFITDKSFIFRSQLYGASIILVLDVIYFFYAQYEGKKYAGCSSYQIGNIIGSVAIPLLKFLVVMGLSYYFL